MGNFPWLAATMLERVLERSPLAGDKQRSLEQFFYSDWYGIPCSIDPHYLISELKKKAIYRYVEKETKKAKRLQASKKRSTLRRPSKPRRSNGS